MIESLIICTLHHTFTKSRTIIWSRTWNTHGRDERNAYRILIGKLGSKRFLGGKWPRREDNIKMDLKGNVRI
jgi:hypothetical protein